LDTFYIFISFEAAASSGKDGNTSMVQPVGGRSIKLKSWNNQLPNQNQELIKEALKAVAAQTVRLPRG
jgi:hypothetical protein